LQFVSTECKVVVDGGAERGSTYKTQTTAFIFSGASDEPLSAGLSACAASWTGVPAGTGVLKLEDITIAARGSECELYSSAQAYNRKIFRKRTKYKCKV
jgi:3-deoxy-D-arabino-heptulosonate 7-phosphate (DAHP) synthase